MSRRTDLLRARVLRLLKKADAGASENWRDSDPGYWVGVAEGAFDVERERDEARALVKRLVDAFNRRPTLRGLHVDRDSPLVRDAFAFVARRPGRGRKAP